jgi:methionyl aminopeptidase
VLNEAAATARKPLDAETLEATGHFAGDFEGFAFTGPLRPAKISPQMTVPSIVPKPDYAETGEPLSELLESRRPAIVVNTAEQIEAMRKAGRVARAVMDEASAMLRPGVTGDEIDRVVFAACVKRGAYPSPLNYMGFPKSVCVSPNEVICHGIPDSRPLEDGDIVNLDVTVFIGGHHADMNETFMVGAVSEESKALVKCAFDCLKKSIDLCRPGVMYREIGDVVDSVAKPAGFSVVQRYCGHGVHRLFHCAPNVPHYRRNKATGVMKAGHTFTIEPMINEGKMDSCEWPDGWTAVTIDGKRSAQFEHTLLVTATGVEVLTAPGVDKPGAAPVTAIEWDAAFYSRPGAAEEASADGVSGEGASACSAAPSE